MNPITAAIAAFMLSATAISSLAIASPGSGITATYITITSALLGAVAAFAEVFGLKRSTGHGAE